MHANALIGLHSPEQAAHTGNDARLATSRAIFCLIRHMDARGHFLRTETVVDGRRQITRQNGAGTGLAQEWLLTTSVSTHACHC